MHKISAAALNSIGASSGCGDFVSYERTLCPENYVPVNSPDGASDFCVAKYEMKKLVTDTNPEGIATSQASGIPWTNINQIEANAECDKLGDDFDLISNSDWMIMARDVESNPSNWITGADGKQTLIRGHTDGAPYEILPSSEDSDNFFKTLDTSISKPNQKRTFELTNGSIVWDISGNAEEWVNTSLKLTQCKAQTAQLVESEVQSFCQNISPIVYLPGNPKGISPYDSTIGIGQFRGGLGAGIRGGKFIPTNFAGIFALRLNVSQDIYEEDVGFRCVYRPSN